MAAAEELAKEGISLRVVDMFCIKPLDEELVVAAPRRPAPSSAAEEHSIIGGLGGAVSEALCKAGAQVPMGFVGTNDLHGECGPYKQLQAKYGLDAAAIVGQVKEIHFQEVICVIIKNAWHVFQRASIFLCLKSVCFWSPIIYTSDFGPPPAHHSGCYTGWRRGP